MDIRANNCMYSDRPARDWERKTIPLGLGLKTTSGRSISASGRSKMAFRADMEVGTLVGAEKPVGFVRKARILLLETTILRPD